MLSEQARRAQVLHLPLLKLLELLQDLSRAALVYGTSEGVEIGVDVLMGLESTKGARYLTLYRLAFFRRMLGWLRYVVHRLYAMVVTRRTSRAV